MPDGDVGKKITLLLESEDGALKIRAEAPGGEAKGEGALPDQAVLEEIEQHNPANLPKGVLARVGRALWDAITVGSVDELMFDTLQDAGEMRETVQVEFRFDPDQVGLTAYPWEMLCNANGQFLVRDGLVDVTRYITYPQNPPRFAANLEDLPLLRIVSSPTNLRPITGAPLAAVDHIVQLSPPTFDEFIKRLLLERETMWALQFDGHGALVKVCANCESANDVTSLACWKCRESLANAEKVGALAFEDASGARWIPTTEFGSMLYNANIPIAVLLACESAMTGGDLVFNGVAPGLLLAGVPAVIGMQYEVSDLFANNFANTFYAMLDSGKGLLESLRLARRMNISEAWYSPVLYLRYRRTEAETRKLPPITEARKVDTAVPGRVTVGQDFLARLWIRRPDTKPLTRQELADMLGTKDDVQISVRDDEDVSIDLKPEAGRKLRRGEVIVSLKSPKCTVTPESIKLFVDEQIDAPPAFFTVRAQQPGKIALVFSVIQDGAQIHTVVHTIDALAEQPALAGGILPPADLQRASSTVPVGAEAATAVMPPSGGAAPAKPVQPHPAPPPMDRPVGEGAGPREYEPRLEPPEATEPMDLEDTPETARVNRDEYHRALEEAEREDAEKAKEEAPPEPEPTLLEGVPEDAIPADESPGGYYAGEPTLDDSEETYAEPPMAMPGPDQTIEHGWGGSSTETQRHPVAPRPVPSMAQPAPSYGGSGGTGMDDGTSMPHEAPLAAAPRKSGSMLTTLARSLGALTVIAIAGVLVISAMGGLPVTGEFGASATQTAVAEVLPTPDVPATQQPTSDSQNDVTDIPDPTATAEPLDPAVVAMTVAAQRFDEVRLNALQTYDVAEVERVSIELAQQNLFAEVFEIQEQGCIWRIEDKGLVIERVTVDEPQTSGTVAASAERTAVLLCDGQGKDRYSGVVNYGFIVRLLEDGRWVVSDFLEERP